MAKTFQTIRVDRSRDHATIHGERGPDDPHRTAFFLQDGLYFDAGGALIPELVPPELKAKVEKKLCKLNGGKMPDETPQAAPAGENDPASSVDDAGKGNEADGDDDDKSSDDINLEAWLTGSANYQWFAISKAIRERFKKNVSKAEDAVVFLVGDQKIVGLDQVADKFKPYLS